MLRQLKNILSKKESTQSELWFGKPDTVQVLGTGFYFKEWMSIADSEILQIYYQGDKDIVSIKSINKKSNVMVNEIVPWNLDFTERQALDHLVQTNPRLYLSFHPDIDNLYFTNMELN